MTPAGPAFRARPLERQAVKPQKRIMPAEWEHHDATWIAWPHHEPDWPGKLGAIPWVYAEIVRALHTHERVEILWPSGKKQVIQSPIKINSRLDVREP